MTTHELATFLEHAKAGMGAYLKVDAGKAFDEAADAFRGLPDQPVKKLAEHIRAMGQPAAKAKPAANIQQIVEQIRAIQSGAVPGDTPLDLESLKNAQLKEILKAFGRPPTVKVADNLNRVRGLIQPFLNGDESHSASIDSGQIEEGVRLYLHLRDTKALSIADVRASFPTLGTYAKPVLEEISRRVGYTPHGSRQDILARLQDNLESIKMSQLRNELIGSGA